MKNGLLPDGAGQGGSDVFFGMVGNTAHQAGVSESMPRISSPGGSLSNMTKVRRHEGSHIPQGLYPSPTSSSRVSDDSSLFLSAMSSTASHSGRWIFLDDVLRT